MELTNRSNLFWTRFQFLIRFCDRLVIRMQCDHIGLFLNSISCKSSQKFGKIWALLKTTILKKKQFFGPLVIRIGLLFIPNLVTLYLWMVWPRPTHAQIILMSNDTVISVTRWRDWAFFQCVAISHSKMLPNSIKCCPKYMLNFASG